MHPESLNGVNRQPSKGLKSNRQKGYILPSTVKIADLIKRHLISGDLHKYQGILAKKNLLTVKLTSNILKNTLLRHYKALQKNKQTNKQKTNRKQGLEVKGVKKKGWPKSKSGANNGTELLVKLRLSINE